MVRVRITTQEWLELRKLALSLNMATADLIAEALRTSRAPLAETEADAA